MLIVGGMTFAFTPKMIKEIRDMNPQARFVMYQWDSEKIYLIQQEYTHI